MHTAGNLIKYMTQIADGGYYNVMDAVSYQRPLIIITGGRGIGKSTDVAAFCILDYLLNERGFLYVRRRDNEVKKTCKKFFENADVIIASKTSIEQFSLIYDKSCYYIQKGEDYKELCGQTVYLSGEESLKSSNLSYIHNIIYDEFISKDPTRYLGTKDTPEKEYEALLSLYQTVDRDVGTPYRNDTRLFLMGNTATIYNPVYLSLNIPDYIQPGARFIRPKGQAWILEQSPLTPPAPEESFIYRLSTEHNRKYAFDNIGDNDDARLIQKPDGPTRYMWTFTMRGKAYGLRSALDGSGLVYVVRRIDSAAPRYSFDVIGYDQSCQELIQSIKSSWQGLALIDCMRRGLLRFDSGQTKQGFLQYFSYI